MSKQTLQLHETVFAIHSLAADTEIPKSVFTQKIFFIAKTADELSIVCPQEIKIDSLDTENDWLALEVVGPLGFSLTGIMANISGILAQAKISIFALSTYDTDYILVKKHAVKQATNALKKEGYHFVGDAV